MVLHGNELQELRGLRILLPIEQVKNALIRFAVTHIRRTVDATGMFQRNFAIKRVQVWEAKLPVVDIPQIHALLERMHRSRSIFPILFHPNLVERIRIILVRNQLLVRHNQRIIEIRKIQAGQSLIFDIRGATAVTGGQHESWSGRVLDITDVRYWIETKRNARNASGVGESFRQNHDDGIVRKLTCSSLIDGFRLLRILLSERFHSFLAVVAGLIHGLDLWQAKECGGRIIGLSITYGIP